MTPLEALLAATSVAADALDIPDVGRIAVGCHADLVVVNGDPLADVRLLQDPARIRLVIKGGQVVADRHPPQPAC